MDDERQSVMNRFNSACHPKVEDQGKAKLIRTWIGCSISVINALCDTGPANLRIRDKGYFGGGIYSTPQASYAVLYSTGEIDNPVPSQTNKDEEYAVLLCWNVVGNLYPVTRKHDYVETKSFSNFYDESNGKLLRPGFDAHFVTVSKQCGYQAVHGLAKEGNIFQFDELVVAEEAQILPWAIVYFKKVSE